MNTTIFQWSRVESCNTPIYIRQDTPDWIVPNTAGDQLLIAIMGKGESARFGNNDVDHLSLDTIMASPFLSLFSSPETQSYPGRDTVLKLEKLEECWLHITDRCNLSCSHCLFSCSPKTKATLSYNCVVETVMAAYRLGTRVFYLTGGEPLLHPDFQKICRFILKNHEDTQLVILTNGIRIPAQLDFFKTLPQNRLFLQISVDGIGEIHENLRGIGTYQKLQDVFGLLSATGIHTTLSMAIHSGNCHQMTDVVALAAKYDFSGVHYMWLLIIGKATPRDFVPPDDLFEQLIRAQQAAEHYHITIDNISNLSTQVFSTPGTKYDLSNAGWRSLAIGPDGTVYPTPALIGQADVRCGNLSKENLESIWRSSEVLKKLRSCSIVQDKSNANDPLKYIVGGGDIDHSYYSGGSFVGHDPYLPLYNQMALWLMAESAKWAPADSPMPRIRRKMERKIAALC